MSNSNGGSRGLWEMLSDYFREASVLILVFGFLDRYLGRADQQADLAHYGSVIGGWAFATFLLGVGCEMVRTYLEAKRGGIR